MARSLIMLCLGGVLLGGSAAVFNPASILAFSGQASPPPRNQDNHERFAESLASLIGGCVEVIAVHDRGQSAYSEVLLWVDDKANPGVIDQDELSVISHNPLFRNVTVYSVNRCGRAKPERAGPAVARASELQVNGGTVSGARRTAASSINLNDRAALTAPSFCDTWRSLPQVQPCVIASSVSDLRLLLSVPAEGAGGAGPQVREPQAGPARLTVSLRWSSESADGAGEASASVEVMSRRASSQQE